MAGILHVTMVPYKGHLQYLKNKKFGRQLEGAVYSALGIAYGFLLSHLLPPPGAV
jgi:hypothetical protein